MNDEVTMFDAGFHDFLCRARAQDEMGRFEIRPLALEPVEAGDAEAADQDAVDVPARIEQRHDAL